jgi:hypothetical protein
MELMLVVVTVVALALAVGMSVIAWRILRDDRERGDARVAFLDALAAPAQTEAAWDDALSVAPFTPARMFSASDERGAPGRRWVVTAAVMLAIAGGAGGAYAFFRADHQGIAGAPRAAASNPAPTPAGGPIDLLSLKHDADGERAFTVTGLVQNPRDGQPVRHVVAIVYLFDDSGAYFASGTAPIDVADLQPGDQSPFVVRISTTTPVTRYRVSFRTEGGDGLAHVDRRGQQATGATVGSGS